MSWTYGDSERLDRARRRKQRDLRVGLGLMTAAVLLFVFGGSWLLTRSAPQPPRITISWPSPAKYGKRTFTPVPIAGSDNNFTVAALIVRKGQPFSVAVEEANRWKIHGVTDGTDENASPIRWSPQANGAVLKVFCRPVAYGLQKLVAGTSLWPTYTLKVQGFVPEPAFEGRVTLKLESKSVSPEILLAANTALKDGQGSATWDDRVVPLLEAANAAVKVPVVRAQESETVEAPVRWYLTEGYSGKRAPNDHATYFALNGVSGSVEDDSQMSTRLARFLVGREPKATLKFIVDENKPPSVVFRIAFDGKGARAGWIKRPGERAATPLPWWDKTLGAGPPGQRLSPSPAPR